MSHEPHLFMARSSLLMPRDNHYIMVLVRGLYLSTTPCPPCSDRVLIPIIAAAMERLAEGRGKAGPAAPGGITAAAGTRSEDCTTNVMAPEGHSERQR